MSANPSTGTLQLPEVVDLNGLQQLAGELLSFRGSDLLADASQVRRIGGQGIQVLLSAVATWREDGLKLRVDSPSQAFNDAIDVLGIDRAELSEG